jgi:hypothetical protein
MSAWGGVVVCGGTVPPAWEEGWRILTVARLKAAGAADLTGAERNATVGH